jgi:hypothetical protein
VERHVTFQNFIVLGIIPGTNYQISFYGWVLVVLALALSVPLLVSLRNQFRIVRAIFRLNAALSAGHVPDAAI